MAFLPLSLLGFFQVYAALFHSATEHIVLHILCFVKGEILIFITGKYKASKLWLCLSLNNNINLWNIPMSLWLIFLCRVLQTVSDHPSPALISLSEILRGTPDCVCLARVGQCNFVVNVSTFLQKNTKFIVWIADFTDFADLGVSVYPASSIRNCVLTIFQPNLHSSVRFGRNEVGKPRQRRIAGWYV